MDSLKIVDRKMVFLNHASNYHKFICKKDPGRTCLHKVNQALRGKSITFIHLWIKGFVAEEMETYNTIEE